jgi:hypothetical protein
MDEAGQASTDNSPLNVGCVQGIKIMKKLQAVVYPLVTVLALAAAFAAHAESPLVDLPKADATGPAKTRAEVRAELFQARADGSARLLQSNYDPMVYVYPQRPEAAPVLAAKPSFLARFMSAQRPAQAAPAVVGEDSATLFPQTAATADDATQVVAGKTAR